MAKLTFDLDKTQRQNPAYWAAATVVAIENGDRPREQITREQLQRLGYNLSAARSDGAKGGDDGK